MMFQFLPCLTSSNNSHQIALPCFAFLQAVFLSLLPFESASADVIPQDAWPLSWSRPARTASELGIVHFKESPLLAKKVAAGELPPLKDRLPEDPVVIEPYEHIGKHGGNARIFESDKQLFNSTEGPLTIDPQVSIVLPNFVSEWEYSDNNRKLTLHLRRGIRWSDGMPLTANDFIFAYRHYLMNKELTPEVAPYWIGSNVVKIDQYALRYEFKDPMPLYVNILAQYGDLQVMAAHYMKNYHPDFVDRDTLVDAVREEGYVSWMAHFKAIREWRRDEPPLTPTLRPFQYVGGTPTEEYFERNPYYWKIDPDGNQLPYIDGLISEKIGNQEVLAAKAATGQVDFAAFELKTQDFPLFKLGETSSGIHAFEWSRVHGSDIVITPNFNYEDKKVRDLYWDFRFRKALSLSINRSEMNAIIYFNRGVERQATVMPNSRFFEPEFATSYTEYSPGEAARLLDEMGLNDRDDDGLREYPGGEPLTLTLEYLDFETPKEISLELIVSYWREIGLDFRLKQVDTALQDRRAKGNLMQMSVWHADRSTDILFPWEPVWYVPMKLGWEHVHWNHWARYYLSGGERGERPPPVIEQLQAWWTEMLRTPDQARYVELGKNILRSNAENLWSIGTVGLAPQPVVVSHRLKNVPRQGYWGWDNRWTMPYHPATWYLDN